MTSANVPAVNATPATTEQLDKKPSEIDWSRLTPRDVANMHRKADTDLRKESLHHTLGLGRNQAFPGDGWSRILAGITLTGSKAAYSATREAQVVAALKAMGAADQTT